MNFSKSILGKKTYRQVKKRYRLYVRKITFSYRVLDRPTWNGLDGRIVNCNTAAAFKT